jgi:hypothetical protein
VELNDSERAALDAIRLEFDGARYRPADWEVRPSTKDEYRVKRDKLGALKRAWAALDQDTQWHLVCGLNAMWVDEAKDQLPDIAPIVDGLLKDMAQPSGAPEQLVGLRRATALLWSAWCERQLVGDVPIGSAAVAEIGAAVSSLFDIDAAEAERRVRHALRSMEKDGRLPRRGTTRRE